MQSFVSNKLSEWYKINQRNHPWKQEPDPYKIWLSEIIMQQTRVEQGTPYYLKFIERYPTVKHLADAPLDEVLKLWEGLGYYSRARNLHHTAKEIVEKYDGKFPTHIEDVLALKGIGQYTASAIVSFAYKQPYAVVDGNVSRVLSRLFGVHEPIDSPEGRREIETLAQNILDKERPDIHNQAIMDFGAILCKPANPLCEECPFANECYAFQNSLVSELPLKQGKVKKRDRKMSYLVIYDSDKTIIQKRIKEDIWKELYQFPEMNSLDPQEENISVFLQQKGYSLRSVDAKKNYRQTLSHQYIRADFYLCNVEEISMVSESEYLIVEKDRLKDYAYPKIIRNFLKDNIFILISILNIML